MEIVHYPTDTLAIRKGEQKALKLFHNAAARVPAYKDFLKKNGIRPAHIKTIKDFSAVPITDPKNYIAAYPLAERCWDGTLSSSRIIATSSGTTGEPKFWPRSGEQELEAAMVHEWLYRTYFGIDKHSTLLLIGFPMGVYVSGMATLLPSWLTAIKKYPVTVMSIGNNKTEMLRAVKNLSDNFDQTILIGHPFFVKDIIESGAREGISWPKKHIGMMFCSEGFTEAWREYVGRYAGIKPGAMRIFNTYGSSEMLLMGYETPFTIKMKKHAEGDPSFLKKLTKDPAAPQFFQYDPSIRYIESIQTGPAMKELIFSTASGVPLIRFNLHDRGEIYSQRDLKEALGSPYEKPEYALPVVSLFGRSDQTIIFYAANIYSDNIKGGLGSKEFFKKLTGKFTMKKGSLKNFDEFLEVNIELQPGVKPSPSFARQIQKALVNYLLNANLEYKFLWDNLDKDITPQIRLWKYNDEKYFKPGLKPKYIQK